VKILPERPAAPEEHRGAVTVRISPMRRRHIRSILKIENVVYPRPWAGSVFASEIDQVPRARRYYVAHIGRRLVGYGGLLVAPDSAHITNVAVDAEFRRQGIASRLLLALARDAITRGSPALTLEVRVGNDGAQQLYRQFGFAPAGMRKRYYEGTDDAIVMWAHDIAEPAYRARLEQIERAIDGSTEWELT
jgi:[ribosomal protein S18]-alanine N-acetyltransferase